LATRQRRLGVANGSSASHNLNPLGWSALEALKVKAMAAGWSALEALKVKAFL